VHRHILAEFAEILHEVVSEGIVIVDHQQHKLLISLINISFKFG
jgi:hypothetical protein